MVLDFHEINIKKNQFQQILQHQFHWRLPNTVKDCDNGYIKIWCVVNSEMVAEIISISLKRFDKNVAFVWFDGDLEDTEFSNRTGVDVSSLIRDVGVSYLSIRIMSSAIKPLKDKGPYRCFLQGFDTNGGFIRVHSTLEMLNITGNTKIIRYVF